MIYACCLDTIPGHQSAFSSYPATVYSGDDFYILSSNMVSISSKFSLLCLHVLAAWTR
jgi:hypothetical protein